MIIFDDNEAALGALHDRLDEIWAFYLTQLWGCTPEESERLVAEARKARDAVDADARTQN